LKAGNFMKQFVTPIVKASKAGKTEVFFTQVEFEAWKAGLSGAPGWHTKYYKGLGTSTAAEAKEYFKAMEQHRLSFNWKENKDGELIDMAFNKTRADDRKKWMNDYEEGSCVDHSKDTLSYRDFINLELVQFARYSVMRSVPSVMDGFKPSQRKVMFCCFKRNLRNDAKVAQLVGYVGEQSAYHHGEASLGQTIVGMAQDFVGSNNVNLLVPSGQFGTRLQGGSDAASTRYIYTRLAPVTRLIFHPFDDPVLTYLEEDGQKIEPKFYVPIIPMVLVNGAAGIGTGWSTDVPNYDPRAIIENLRLFLAKKKMKHMKPWYRGFSGSIENISKGSYYSWGKWKDSAKGIEITELPIRKWTQDYKEFLHTMLPGSDKPSKISVQDVREYHTEDKVHFALKINEDEMKKMHENGMEHSLKLWSTINETNMVLFDSEGRIKKYKSTLEILEEFATVRLQYYHHRKKYLIDKLTLERDLLSNRARFIALIVAKKLQINNRKKDDVVKDLTRLKFQKFGDLSPPRNGFEYLLIMQIVSLTKERKEELERMAKQKGVELEKIKRTAAETMWSQDLEQLSEAIEKLLAQNEEEVKGTKRKASGSKRGVSSRSSRKKDKSTEGDEPALSDEEAAADGDLDNPFSDIARWTSGSLKSAYLNGPPARKKRRA